MSDLEESFEDGILTLTMNRPKARNAMSGEMMSAMQAAIPKAAVDPAVRCVVLTGAGGAFCAGGDVKGFASDAGSNENSSGETSSLEARVQGFDPVFREGLIDNAGKGFLVGETDTLGEGIADDHQPATFPFQ